MIYMHKVLPLIISPIFLILALLITGLFKNNKKIIVGGILLLCIMSLPIIGGGLLRLVESKSVRLEPNDMPKADAVVVLSGMLTWVPAKNGLIQEWGDPDRFWGGIELIKAEKAPLLIFTGGKLPWETGQGNEGDYLKKYAQLLGVPAQNIIVTPDVQNTEQEASAVSEILKSRRDIILVTSAFHMARAKANFERKGFRVAEYPVDFRVGEGDINLMDFLPHASSLGQTDLAIRELAGRAFYKIKALIIGNKPRDIIEQ
jgi:uncharacterized SAM-binding protein YcdF (DUF218 family)